MQTTRKVTVVLPAELLRRAQKATQKAITPTIRRGLELLAAACAYDQLRKLRGRVKFSVNLHSLREDRHRD